MIHKYITLFFTGYTYKNKCSKNIGVMHFIYQISRLTATKVDSTYLGIRIYKMRNCLTITVPQYIASFNRYLLDQK